MIPGKVFKGMGGAMDLISNPDETKIVVTTDHLAKDGSPKIVAQCSLPLTGARCVSTIITDLVSSFDSFPLSCESLIKDLASWTDTIFPQCVFQVDRLNGGLTLTELAPGVDVEQIKAKTEADFAIAENVISME
jgi:3-oxoacid CoA-transferase